MMGCCKYGKEISCPITFRATQILCVDVSYRYGSCLVKLVRSNNNNNNNNIYLLQLGCHPVAVVILHVYKT